MPEFGRWGPSQKERNHIIGKVEKKYANKKSACEDKTGTEEFSIAEAEEISMQLTNNTACLAKEFFFTHNLRVLRNFDMIGRSKAVECYL